MPKDNIERAVRKGTGELEGVDYSEVTYEAYGPGGVAILIYALTDNATRTVADIRHKLSRRGGNMGSANSVAWMFDKKGQIYIDVSRQTSEDALLEAALEAGAEDFRREDDQYVVTTEPAALHAVRAALESHQVSVREAEIADLPRTTVRVEGDAARTLLKLLEELEDLDDVQKVASNFDMDMAQLAEA
jgi:YebC/PmpR family DNA-binding regulatory protein